jgi:hypothetical protein
MINLSNYYDKCVLYETALSNKDGKTILYNSEQDNYGGFSLIKIDVENHKKGVIGGRETILRNRPTVVLENSHYHFSDIFPNPNPHMEIFEELGYKRIYSNVCDSSMDIWVPK